MEVIVAISNSVARVTLDRPPLNVIDLPFATALANEVEALAPRDGLNAVVLEARGRAFSAGVDVRDHLPDRGAAMIVEFHRACLALWNLPVPVLARVHGPALGGGAELTLVCDVVHASDLATFGFPEIRLGVFPPVAAAMLARVIPPHAAAELMLGGRTVDAAEAYRLGLVTRLAPAAGLDAMVEAQLHDWRALSASSLKVTKQAMRRAGTDGVPGSIAIAERIYLERLLHDADAVEGLQAFLDKRPPRWRADRRP